MLTKNLINHNIPRLQLQDSVGKALQLINDFKISHLPVVAEKKLLGLISEDDLLDVEDEKYTIEVLQDSFLQTAVPDNVHFLNAVSSSIQHDTSIVPIINSETNFEGVITVTDMLKTLGNFSGADEIGGIIVLEMARSQFAISEISRIVESNDSTVLHLNTTTNHTTGLLTVTLHISKKEIASIVATFERYDYDVVYSYGTEKFENEVSGNYQNLMNYLGI
ncbi:CBS domain-containing protein [Ferruginibacter yonginensis]|uniref:CBS domain-containing protein n=1 Tax=Ferruginibacter yonginensis TaxID=1310416 RepID=A0ABV8QT80_9BACT